MVAFILEQPTAPPGTVLIDRYRFHMVIRLKYQQVLSSRLAAMRNCIRSKTCRSIGLKEGAAFYPRYSKKEK